MRRIMPIKLLRRGLGGPPGSTEVTAMNSIGIDYRKRYSAVYVVDEAGSIRALSEGVSPGRMAAV